MRVDCKFANTDTCAARADCIGCESFESTLEFVPYPWIDYASLWNRAALEAVQISLLQPTGLQDFEGNDLKFFPTQKILDLSNKAMELYKSLTGKDSAMPAMCKEALHSSAIEGAKASLHDAVVIARCGHSDSNIDHTSAAMLRGAFKASSWLTLTDDKLTLDRLIEAWNILVTDCCENEDIRGERFRSGDVCVGNHVGTPHQHVEEDMQNWLDYYNSEILEEHPFIKAAILHFAFESIHPFCDGNGRLGRILVYAFLENWGLDRICEISISETIHTDVSKYYSALSAGDNIYKDCTAFITYFLEVICQSFCHSLMHDNMGKLKEEYND